VVELLAFRVFRPFGWRSDRPASRFSDLPGVP
jgi:hypothetical protein